MSQVLDKLLRWIKAIIPKSLFSAMQPYYHRFLAFCAAVRYGFPSQKLYVIGVTGTNGKSTTVEFISRILEEAGYTTASFSSLRFRIAGQECENKLKMTMPGRFKVQEFLKQAVDAGCTHAVIEVTSEGIVQSRHRHIKFDMAVLTNVTPEHIESHGSFENYRAAKAELFKISKIHVLNREDASYPLFAAIPAKKTILYAASDLPADIHLNLSGDFNRANGAAARAVGRELAVDDATVTKALERVANVPGRLEFVQRKPFAVVVDYAHTPDALEKVYQTLKKEGGKLVCVLGSAGGGRDKWKRPEMGKIAGEYCSEIVLTNEDPYDESPEQIMHEVAEGISPKHSSVKKILDRREGIRQALHMAEEGDIVIITGKGAEPWLMGPNGSKIPWDDRQVVREELKERMVSK
jgi:UDP-N-acetylmuramoyl-L-alanyl-D-glutamate--2,6-diaminopimelate ligase